MDSLFTPLLSIHFHHVPSQASGEAALAVEIAVPLLLLILGSSVAVCYRKRKKISEHLLWRLAGFRFNTLIERDVASRRTGGGAGAG